MGYTSAPSVCPPHHWLIVETAVDRQQWTCQRCEARQEHDTLAPPTWHGGPSWSLPKKLQRLQDPGD
jgi:hypothetical protein